MQKVSLVLRGPANMRNRVLVGDHDLTDCVSGVILHADCRSVPQVQLNLTASDLIVNGDMTVELDSRFAEALIALGWTPPLADRQS